ncbi:MAG: Ppx/GppA family phosphatase [Alphaproteobacteria bacterium]|nr:Ppx/GppA family phosphatase [Alphaproteobacteria bacterium]
MVAYVKPRWRRDVERKPEGGRGRHALTFAAIDLGTNNCRLLVARPSEDGFRVIDAFSRIVRLGEGVSETGALTAAAMDRTIDALRVCAAKMRRRRVDRARLVATDACRRAINGTEFLDRVAAETGLHLEVISTEEEARLALRGCAPLFASDKRRALVFDIGGGSTEVMVLDTDSDCGASKGKSSDGSCWISLPFGVVSLSERYGRDVMSRESYAAMMEDVDKRLAPFCARNGIAGSARDGELQMLGASGTVTTLTGVHLDLPRYDRSQVDGAYLGFNSISKISDRLRTMCCEERASHPCIGSDRADLVVAGCAILEAMCRRWPVGQLRVADRGLREGILLDLMVAAAQGAQRRAQA